MRKSLIVISILIGFYSCTQPETYIDFSGKEKLRQSFQLDYDSLLLLLNPSDQLYYKELYELMPLQDKLDYSPEYHYNGLITTITARKELSWGKGIPENLFKHFVLPQRVNNENLDSSRTFFYNKIKDRIEGMSMLDAAMEINHFCHEHMTYQSSSERTSSPMTSYRNGYGRCGEESVFVVAALRAMCIPARQVYTPRWAHTDDNHAWVEFWADGKWYYFGATEPLALPNMGWFTEPARRAMLVGTRINGKYDGDERINYQTGSYTVINTTSVYAPTKEVFVKLTDSDNKPLTNSSVDFQIYNYGEFFTLGPKKTDSNGIASFLTGYGDLWVWATDGEKYAFAELDVRKTDTLFLTVDQNKNRNFSLSYDYNPPARPDPLEVPQEGVEANKIRLHYEDSLRKAMETTFPDSIAVFEITSQLDFHFNEIYTYFIKSRGNWAAIKEFLYAVPENRKEEAVLLLGAISEKDLHDVTANTLMDHLLNTKPYSFFEEDFSETIWKDYILNPRVEYEMLYPYREYLINKFNQKGIENPEELFVWMKDSLTLDTTNYSHVPISAKGSFESGFTDGVSRDLIFVEGCRSMGIPARLEAGSLKPQYYSDGKWITKDFYDNKKISKTNSYSYLHLENKSGKELRYYKHFTIAKWNNGKFYTLEYEWDKKLKDFPEELKLRPGYYRITIGNRQSDGSVLGEFIFFEATANDTIVKSLSLRTQPKDLAVLGTIDSNSELLNANKKACSLIDNNFVIAIWIDPLQEPSKHIIQDINKLKDDFEKKGNRILLITPHQVQKEELDPNYFSNLPATASFAEDNNWKILNSLNNQFHTKLKTHLPVVTIINPQGEIVFLKMGYTIGIGEEMINLLR